MAAPPPRSRARRFLAITGWILIAFAVPSLAAFLQQVVVRAASRGDVAFWVGTGSIAGALFGVLLGFRSGRLAGWAFGPPFGFLVGVLDVRLFDWVVRREILTIGQAAYLPLWGLGLGAFASLPRRRMAAILGIALAAAAAQVLAQGLWSAVCHTAPDRMRWVLESWVYAFPALVFLLGNPRRRSNNLDSPKF